MIRLSVLNFLSVSQVIDLQAEMSSNSASASPAVGSELDRQIEHLKKRQTLKVRLCLHALSKTCKLHHQESEVKVLCLKAQEILMEESNVQRVDAPVTVRSCALQ